jgi:hypothetical protein
MAAHHRISISVACPVCEATGELQIAEDAGPPFADAPRRTYAVDPVKFSFLVGGEPAAMACVACGARFSRPA